MTSSITASLKYHTTKFLVWVKSSIEMFGVKNMYFEADVVKTSEFIQVSFWAEYRPENIFGHLCGEWRSMNLTEETKLPFVMHSYFSQTLTWRVLRAEMKNLIIWHKEIVDDDDIIRM